MRMTQWRSYVATVIVLLILFIAGASVLRWGYLRTFPDEDAQHLKEFLKSMPPIEGIYSRQSGGTTYLEVVGTLPPAPLGVSGPPIYIFDSRGKLIDWTREYGEDSTFERRWPLGATRHRLSEDEALRFVESTSKS